MKVSTLFHLTILAFLLVLLVVSFSYPLQLSLMPWLFIGAAGTFEAFQLAREIVGRRTAIAGDEDGLSLREWVERLRGSDRGYLSAIGWIVGFWVGLYLLGFLVTMPLFTISYLRAHGNTWRFSIGLSVAVWAVFFALFIFGLKVSLYQGELYPWLFS